MTTIAIVAASLCVLNVVLWIVLLSRFSSLFSTDDVVKKTNDELSKIMTEMDSITNRNLDLIDDKINALKEAEREAEQKIAMAKAEIVKLEIAKTTPHTIPVVNMNTIATDIVHQPTTYQYEVQEVQKQPLEKQVLGQQSLEIENVVVPREKNPVSSRTNFSNRVQDLAHRGYSIAEIASELSSSTSAVAFALEMSK